MEDRWHGAPRSLPVSAGLVLIVAVPLIGFALRFVGEARLAREVLEAVRAEIAAMPDAPLVEVNTAAEDSVLHLRVTVRTSRQLTYAEVVVLHTNIATRLQRPVALQLIDVPTVKLDPLIPPTHTPTLTHTLTPTPGPSATRRQGRSLASCPKARQYRFSIAAKQWTK